MTTIARVDAEQHRQGLLGLAALLIGLALGAGALHVAVGSPRLPADLPDWQSVVATLRGSELSLDVVAYVLTMAAWVVWLWLATSLALRLIVGASDRLTHGAAWIRALGALSDRVTLPVVRRVADGALVALVIVNLVGRAPASATAAAAAPAVMTVTVAPADLAGQTTLLASQGPEDQQTIEYTIEPGDTLWALSERFYGTGHEFPRLVAANAGRVMPDGEQFTQAGVVQPGWILLIPLPNRTVDHSDGYSYYAVEAGDTLRGVAARLLGDAARWPEIFELNRGMAELSDGLILTDPDLIWPGLRLRLPLPAPAGAAEPSPPPAQPLLPNPAPNEPASTTSIPPPLTPVARTPAPPTAVPQTSTTPTPTAAVEPQSGASNDTPAPLVYGAATLAAVTVAGGAALLVRRVRRSLSEPPVSPTPKASPPPGDGFAEAELARALTHRLRGDEVEPVILLTAQLHLFLEDEGVGGVSVVLACRARNATTLYLRAGLLQRTRLVDAVRTFGTRMGGSVRASVTPDYDIAMRLSGRNGAGLLTPPSRPDQLVPLLPFGITPSGETLYANWRELGHVLVTGLPGGGVEVALTSLVAALTARCRPEELHLWTIARRRSLPVGLLKLPHQRGVIEPDDGARVGDLLGQLRAEIVRRLDVAGHAGEDGWRPQSDEPEFVLVVSELSELADDGTTLELIGSLGAAVGVRLVAATTQAGMVGADVLPHLATRLALQTLDDDESIQLVGQPDAVDLGSGEFLLRIDGRSPVRLRGFRVPAEHLVELARLMRAAYGHDTAAADLAGVGAEMAATGVPPAPLHEGVVSWSDAQGV
ncbi:MAG: LysM peptidoglycan-binding domain-containing protein, partial [Dehalococcoidia bacterium]